MQTAIAPFSQHSASTVQPLKIVAIGDSIIYGFGDPVGGGWVERLRRVWMIPGSLGHAVYNLGIRGDGVKQVSERLEAEFRQRGELRNRFPDRLILSVGVNDSARLNRSSGRNFTDFHQFQAEITDLLDRANRLCPVLFVGMVPVDEAKMPFLNCLYYNQADQFRYKEVTRLACVERQIPYLDVFAHWMRRGEVWCREQMLEDGLHPNVSGYEALLDQVLNWDSLIEQVGLSVGELAECQF